MTDKEQSAEKYPRVCPLCSGLSKEEVYELTDKFPVYYGGQRILILVCNKHADKEQAERTG